MEGKKGGRRKTPTYTLEPEILLHWSVFFPCKMKSYNIHASWKRIYFLQFILVYIREIRTFDKLRYSEMVEELLATEGIG